MKFGFDLPRGQQRLHVRRRRLRLTTEHGYTISLPYEPNGSDELKI